MQDRTCTIVSQWPCPSSLTLLNFCRLGNCYLLLAMMSVAILYTTQEPKVVRNYVIALWLADISHVFITCYIMEYKRVVDVANWNAMA